MGEHVFRFSGMGGWLFEVGRVGRRLESIWYPSLSGFGALRHRLRFVFPRLHVYTTPTRDQQYEAQFEKNSLV